MTFLAYLLVMIFFFFFNLKHINVVSLTHFIVGTAEVFFVFCVAGICVSHSETEEQELHDEGSPARIRVLWRARGLQGDLHW